MMILGNRRNERTIYRQQQRILAEFEAAGLSEDATAAAVHLRRLNAEYTAFSKAAGLLRQIERMRVEYPGELTDDKRFAPLKDYDGKNDVVGKFYDRQDQVNTDFPKIKNL